MDLVNYMRQISVPMIFAMATNDDQKILELRGHMLDLNERAQVIQATADAEKRPLLEDEEKELDKIFNEFEQTEAEIERRQLIMSQTAKLSQSQGRQAEAQLPETQNRAQGEEGPEQPRRQAAKRPAREVYQPEDRGKWGWKNFGDFAQAVRNGASKGGIVDPRLVMNAPTTYSSEGVGADGGFAVPPDFRTEIWQKVSSEEALLSRTDQQVTTKNSMTWPADETTPWDTTGGVQAYWESEVGQITQSKLALQDKTIRLNKLTALVPVTQELMEDAPALDGYLRSKVGTKFDFKITSKIVSGVGAGEPEGILTAASLVSVSKELGQDADTVVAENISNMWSRMYAPLRRNSIWLINQDIEPQLDKMTVGTGIGQVPVYVPAGGYSASPYGTLKGRPVIPTQACETLGDKGDIILVDLSQYLTAVKSGNIRTDVSMHLWFDYDVLAYRFIIRMAGQPWWKTYITPRDSTNYLSWAVTLDERA